mgnify:FL=1
MKKQLACPVCGHYPAMSSSEKVYLFYHQEPKCPNCGTILSNPFWFDIIRVAVALGLTIWSIPHIRDWWGIENKFWMVICLIVAELLYYIGGLISLYLIPLRQHWKTN